MIRIAAGLAMVAAAAAVSGADAGDVVVRELYLMGTRATIALRSGDRVQGLQTIEGAVRVLESTEAQLSTWRDDSVISLLNRHPINEPLQLPPALCRTFAVLTDWYAMTERTFDPGIGRLTDAWGLHAGGRVPDARLLRGAREVSGLHHFSFDRDRCQVARTADATIDVGGFGKGDALDRVADVLGDRSWMIDLGGQVAVRVAPGDRGWPVALAHPRDRQRALFEVSLREGSLSTSGGSERDSDVNGRRIGHILDPRSGRPAAFDGSVVVWHRDALVADILSTALYVMGPRDGLGFSARQGIAACFFVPEQNGGVRTLMSPAFKHLVS
jgi:thiamine biosynthesis lipoprotein